MSTPSATMTIDFVRIRPGETLTIWAQPDVEKTDSIQVEIRVTSGGQIVLFCDEALIGRPFSKWVPMEKQA